MLTSWQKRWWWQRETRRFHWNRIKSDNAAGRSRITPAHKQLNENQTELGQTGLGALSLLHSPPPRALTQKSKSLNGWQEKKAGTRLLLRDSHICGPTRPMRLLACLAISWSVMYVQRSRPFLLASYGFTTWTDDVIIWNYMSQFECVRRFAL